MLQSNEKIIKHKVGLLNLAEELGNVSRACQIMGLSRDTFYRYRDAVEDGGVEALLERPRRSPNLKNRVDIETENAVVAYAVEYPAHGQVPRLQRITQTRRVRFRVRGALDLDAQRLANFKTRLKALEAKVAEDGIILTEAQAQALEKKKLDDEARLFAALRPDYAPVVHFALLSGCRKSECCALTWRQIDWHNQTFTVTGKGGRTRTIPMTGHIRNLLRELPRADSQVFTFKSKRADFAPRGSLHPVKPNGLRAAFDLALKHADIENFRFHDLRHPIATQFGQFAPATKTAWPS